MAATPRGTRPPPGWGVTQDSGANASQVVAKAGAAGLRHYVAGFSVVIGAAVVGAADLVITLQDGAGTILWKEIIGTTAARGTRLDKNFPAPLELTAGNAANLNIAAGGAGCVTTGNLNGYTL